MTNAQSKSFKMFCKASIARGDEWFKYNADEYFNADKIWKKERILNLRDSVKLWAHGNFERTIVVSELEGLSTKDFIELFEETYDMAYALMWKYSNVENCADLIPALNAEGYRFQRTRTMDAKTGKFDSFVFAICDLNTDFIGVTGPQKQFKIPTLCECGCGEYGLMKKTQCCGRRYVNVAHQRSQLIGKKCPCKAEEEPEEISNTNWKPSCRC